jgi:hypothetical protein
VSLPEREQQIRQAHAGMIVQIVRRVQDPQLAEPTEALLQQAEQNGWTQIVAVMRRIIAGERGEDLLNGLDEEDRVIARAILEGIRDPGTLPDPERKPDATMAAPGLALMIHQAGRGDAQALQLLSHMAEQMTAAGGDMRLLGGILRRLIDGERDPAKLSQGMGTQGRQLVDGILEELHMLAGH